MPVSRPDVFADVLKKDTGSHHGGSGLVSDRNRADDYSANQYSTNDIYSTNQYPQYSASQGSMNPNGAGEPSSYQQYGSATKYGGKQYGREEQDINQYGDEQYDQEGNSPLRLPITIYGKSGHEFDIFASIDNGAKESWMSLTMLNYLELPYKAAHKSQRTHSMRIDNRNVESMGTVVCELSLSTAGSKLQKFIFQVYKHYLPRVILGMKSTEKEVMGKYLTKAVQSPVPQERYKIIKLLLIRWKEEGGLQCAGEVDSV
jgi:hypothetical protein